MASGTIFIQKLADLFYKRNRASSVKGQATNTLREWGGVWCPPWEIAKKFVEKLGTKIFSVSEKKVKKAAEDYKKLVLDTLEQQRYASRWQPLNAKYLAWKRRVGRDSRILIATREYMQSIEVVKKPIEDSPVQKRVFFVVGLPDKIHKDSGIPIRKLARIHEFGATRYNKKGQEIRIPARPLWRPTMAEFQAKNAKKILERIQVKVFEEVDKLVQDFQKSQADYRQGLNP